MPRIENSNKQQAFAELRRHLEEAIQNQEETFDTHNVIDKLKKLKPDLFQQAMDTCAADFNPARTMSV